MSRSASASSLTQWLPVERDSASQRALEERPSPRADMEQNYIFSRQAPALYFCFIAFSTQPCMR